jgi:hypothetical protein
MSPWDGAARSGDARKSGSLARAAAAVFMLVALACGSATQEAPSAQAELLRKWALCRCLAKSAVSKEAGEDATKSAAAYLEAGTASIEIYESLEQLVDVRLQEKRSGSVNAAYNTMKCIDLYRSKELANLTDQVAGESRKAE